MSANEKKTLIDVDPWLKPYADKLAAREKYMAQRHRDILAGRSLRDFAISHLYYGLHRKKDGWVFREWAPNATGIIFVSFLKTGAAKFQMQKLLGSNGDWEVHIPTEYLNHGSHYKLIMQWKEGDQVKTGERLPSHATYVVQDAKNHIFDAVVWAPEKGFEWTAASPARPDEELIYEAHVGMSGDRQMISTYRQFEREILPRIIKSGYNTIQLMAIQEHPYYGSFGYQVSNFFAESSRFGTPDDLKHLIDAAHKAGLRVTMDLIHSHAVKNEVEGLSRFDGTLTQYFKKENHQAWDSRIFDYGKPEVARFLLSNVRFWMEEYHFDGFRFDGVTSMIYHNHGLNQSFTNYDDYFSDNTDLDALTYLQMANELIHELNSSATTVAEDMSGMPGLCWPTEKGGIGFDYRFNMGAPDLWIKMLKDQRDEDWDMSNLFHQLTSRRAEEKTINYCESHDQALVGDKTIMFRLADKAMYDSMSKDSKSLEIDRAMALHKMIRLITAVTNAGGYLNFMGNEFGHPEWIDFPREGNDWSFKYARRQWHLVDDPKLRYTDLNEFDKAMISLVKELDEPYYSFVRIDEGRKLISFVRNGKLFAFNFSKDSYSGCKIAAPLHDYRIVLSTDDKQYGGFGRIDTSMTYPGKTEQGNDSYIQLYLPARTAVVLRPQYYDLKKSPWA